MSVFVAVDLDATVRAEVVALVEVQRRHLEAKWLRADKFHCTLVFLGHPTADTLTAMEPVLAALGQRHRHFSLRLQGAGLFTTARAPSVLWLGVTGQIDALRSLQSDASQCLEVPEREYVPHVTLARARGPDAFATTEKALAGFRSSDIQVSHLTLYESNSDVYRILYQVPLLA